MKLFGTSLGHKVLVLVIVPFVSLSFQAEASSPGAVVDVTLSPTGDFKAKTDEVTGEAYRVGDQVRAENIKVSLKNLKTGMSLRDRHARDKYLEVGKYPDAVLTKAVGKNGVGKGRLKIRGVEKEVSGKYKVEDGMLKAEFPIKLSDYNISGIRYMGVGVEDQVTIHIVVPVKDGAPPAATAGTGAASETERSGQKRRPASRTPNRN